MLQQKKVIMALSFVFLAVLIAEVSMVDSAEAESVGTFVGGGAVYALDETDGVYTATASWDGNTSEVTIEATVFQNEKTYVVNHLNAFSSNSIVTKVIIKPNNQLTLPASAFANNSNLEYIEIGEGIVDIPNNFANKDEKLVSVTLEHVETIGSNAFQGCKLLTSANLSKVSSLGANAFHGCVALNELTLSSNLETVGNYAFKGCNALQTVIVPGGIITTGTGMFQACNNLTTVTIEPGLKTLGNNMFENCISLKTVNLGNIQGIGKSSFSRCSSLESVTIPDSVKEIGNTAFQKCTSLTSCNLGSGLEKLGSQVFVDCPISGKFVIPASLTSISLYLTGKPTFPAGLTEIEVDSNNTVYSSKDGMLYNKTQTTLLYCPGGKTGEVYVSASIDAYAFTGCHISKITVLEGAISIGNAAFKADSENPTLEELILPNSLESIGNNIVSGQTKLKAIILPSTLGSLGNNTFNGLSSLEYVVFPSTAFKTTTVDTFNGVTFILADGSAVPKTTVNGTVDNLQELRFVWDGSVKGTFYQVSNDQVLFTTVINGDKTYMAVSKNAPCGIKSPEGSDHMVFDGWYTNSELTESYDMAANVTADVVVYAKFSLETHTITYKVDGEDVGEIETYEYGKLVSVREKYEKLGYTVSDWICSGAVPVEGIVAVGDEDIVFTATSAVNQYTITFDTVGGSAVDSITQDYNTAVTAPSMGPSKDGYRFVMWTPEVPASMPANDVILKAVWAIVATANADGKSVVTLDSETSSFIPAAETKEITVEIRENTAVKVENASDLIGKTVVSKVEPVSNSTGVPGTAYEFTFTADGTQYNGKIQVTLPYTKEAGKEPVVYYWNGSESTKMNVVSSTDASVTFETDHNSMYVVASETPSKDDGASFLLYFGILIVAGICAAVLIGFNFYHKKA